MPQESLPLCHMDLPILQGAKKNHSGLRPTLHCVFYPRALHDLRGQSEPQYERKGNNTIRDLKRGTKCGLKKWIYSWATHLQSLPWSNMDLSKCSKSFHQLFFGLKLPLHWTLHNMFHTSLLTLYQEMLKHKVNYHEPPLDLIEGEEEYELEQILNSQCHEKNKQLQYLIWWKWYSTMHNSWTDAWGVHASDLLEKYFQWKKKAI